ncbi:potassium-transporting ATPase subunit KdpB, partial [Dubosiella newyorkensis]|uniref:potassium-transporting ATPase subunit KdpB n=1 Tax=Dubosiella newyorkensis TaxID=1862672 RepID=UPI00272D313B
MNSTMIKRAVFDSFKKLDPRTQIQNPVMFLVYLSAIAVTLIYLAGWLGFANTHSMYTLTIALLLWFTCLFANFAEAIAEGRGKAQADSLRKAKKDIEAFRIESIETKETITKVNSTQLHKGDLVLVEAGMLIPADGDVIEGAASIDESAITGESAPVIREAGGDRSAVSGGTRVLSDSIVVQISQEAGEGFLDKMIAMVEGASRKKTPNEIALQIFLLALTLIFILVVLAMYGFSEFAAQEQGIPNPTSITTLIALLVCLAPTTIGALLSAIGIAGMSRLNQENVLAMSGRAIEAAGDVDVLLLDKTGTITLGNRQAVAFLPVEGVEERELALAATLSSLADDTPEGRSVLQLAKERYQIEREKDAAMEFIPFSAMTRMSGVLFGSYQIRKGAADSVKAFVQKNKIAWPKETDKLVEKIARSGGTPLVVLENERVLGVIHLKDIIKEGVQEKFEDMRKMGIKTIMITGDNPLTAAAIAAEAGVDDFLAQATPEGKLAMIKDYQKKGHLVAMTGDGVQGRSFTDRQKALLHPEIPPGVR